MNTFGQPRLDALATVFLASREYWERWRDVPRYTLGHTNRIAKERAQSAAVLAAMRLEDALKAAGPDAYWSDGTNRLHLDAAGRLRVEPVEMEAPSCHNR